MVKGRTENKRISVFPGEWFGSQIIGPAAFPFASPACCNCRGLKSNNPYNYSHMQQLQLLPSRVAQASIYTRNSAISKKYSSYEKFTELLKYGGKFSISSAGNHWFINPFSTVKFECGWSSIIDLFLQVSSQGIYEVKQNKFGLHDYFDRGILKHISYWAT